MERPRRVKAGYKLNSEPLSIRIMHDKTNHAPCCEAWKSLNTTELRCLEAFWQKGILSRDQQHLAQDSHPSAHKDTFALAPMPLTPCSVRRALTRRLGPAPAAAQIDAEGLAEGPRLAGPKGAIESDNTES